jgi:hypothetical protein
VKSDEIGDLHLALPNSPSGETRLRILLVAPDGEVIADTETILSVSIVSEAALVPPSPKGEPKPELTEPQSNEAPPKLATKDAEMKPRDPSAVSAATEMVDDQHPAFPRKLRMLTVMQTGLSLRSSSTFGKALHRQRQLSA